MQVLQLPPCFSCQGTPLPTFLSPREAHVMKALFVIFFFLLH